MRGMRLQGLHALQIVREKLLQTLQGHKMLRAIGMQALQDHLLQRAKGLFLLFSPFHNSEGNAVISGFDVQDGTNTLQ